MFPMIHWIDYFLARFKPPTPFASAILLAPIYAFATDTIAIHIDIVFELFHVSTIFWYFFSICSIPFDFYFSVCLHFQLSTTHLSAQLNGLGSPWNTATLFSSLIVAGVLKNFLPSFVNNFVSFNPIISHL